MYNVFIATSSDRPDVLSGWERVGEVNRERGEDAMRRFRDKLNLAGRRETGGFKFWLDGDPGATWVQTAIERNPGLRSGIVGDDSSKFWVAFNDHHTDRFLLCSQRSHFIVTKGRPPQSHPGLRSVPLPVQVTGELEVRTWT